jgi:peptide/nickel transport system substrate-binding protein
VAKADRIIFKALTDPATRVAALRGGEVHVIFAPPPEELASLQRDGFVVTLRACPHVWYLQLNANEPYWKDRRVRQAFFMSINRAGMAKELLKGTALPAISVNGRTCDAWTDKAGYANHDPAQAKKLLAEAGYANGFETTFQIPTGGSGEEEPVPMAEWIAADAARVGIKLKLQTMEWITYLHAWAAGMKGGVGLNQQSWGMTSIYWPNLPLRTTSVFNVGHQPDKRFDALLDEANSALDENVAIAKYRAVDALNAREMWFLPIVNDLAPVAISPKVRNFVHSPDWWWDFRKVWVKA